jgi:Cu/Ag efflux pump CusA
VDQTVARYGLQAGEVSDRIQAVLLGSGVGRSWKARSVSRSSQNTPIRAGLETARTPSPGFAECCSIRLPVHVFRWRALRRFKKTAAPISSCAKGVQRRVVVQCNVAGRDLQSTVEDIRQRLRKALQLPQGYRVEYGGRFESAERAYQRLLLLESASSSASFLS